MSTITVSHDLDRWERDYRAVPREAARDCRETVRRACIVGNTVARDNARRTAGRHGKHYPKAFSWEMSGNLFGNGYTGEYGPEAGRRQGGMSFESGSRNQPAHNDLAKSADLIGPAMAGDIAAKIPGWFRGSA